MQLPPNQAAQGPTSHPAFLPNLLSHSPTFLSLHIYFLLVAPNCEAFALLQAFAFVVASVGKYIFPRFCQVRPILSFSLSVSSSRRLSLKSPPTQKLQVLLLPFLFLFKTFNTVKKTKRAGLLTEYFGNSFVTPAFSLSPAPGNQHSILGFYKFGCFRSLKWIKAYSGCFSAPGLFCLACPQGSFLFSHTAKFPSF